MDSLGWSWDGRWWRCHGAAAPAEGARGAGGAPAREERRGPAGEDQWEVENRFRGLPRVEDGERRGLHGGLGGGGGHGGQRGFLGAVGARGSFWERERVERAGELGSALMHSKEARWRTDAATRSHAARAVCGGRQLKSSTVHQIQNFNSTSKIRLKA